eukprot:gene8507-26781_t
MDAAVAAVKAKVTPELVANVGQGGGMSVWRLDLKNGDGEFTKGKAKKGEFIGATLTMHDDIFVQLVSGEIDAMMALLRGKVMLTGSKKQAAKLQALFQRDDEDDDVPTSMLGKLAWSLFGMGGVGSSSVGRATAISPDIAVKQHSDFFMRFIDMLPQFMESVDTNRMTLVFFTISGLDLLGTLDRKISPEQKKEIIDWIYSLQVVVPTPPAGFRGASFIGALYDPCCEPHGVIPYDGGHLAMSYTALASLAILGDDFSRVCRRDMARALSAYQKADGSFMCAEDGEVDMRFTYCAACIAYFLNDWSESHGSFAFCGVASLALMGKINEVLPKPKKEKLLKWLLLRQESGFCGRPHKPVDTCYSFWVGSTITLLGGAVFTQHTDAGGFSKWIDVMADPLHSYMAISDAIAPGRRGVDGGVGGGGVGRIAGALAGLCKTAPLCALMVVGGVVYKCDMVAAENEVARKLLSGGLVVGGAVIAWRVARGILLVKN